MEGSFPLHSHVVIKPLFNHHRKEIGGEKGGCEEAKRVKGEGMRGGSTEEEED